MAVTHFKKGPFPSSLALAIFVLFFFGLLASLSALGWVASDFAVSNHSMAQQPPSLLHFFGTDFMGRDVWSRTIKGSQIALTIGLFAASLSTLIGLILGLAAGYFGGWTDRLVVWIYSSLDSIPSILLIGASAFIFDSGLTGLYLVLGLTGWVQLCRVTRTEASQLKRQDYIVAARAMGLGDWQVIFKHLLPNVAHLAAVEFSLGFVSAIKMEVILSYLGLGAEPGTPSWGTMISDARVEVAQGVWWNFAAATGSMFALILSVYWVTDALRVRLDPKLNLE